MIKRLTGIFCLGSFVALASVGSVGCGSSSAKGGTGGAIGLGTGGSGQGTGGDSGSGGAGETGGAGGEIAGGTGGAGGVSAPATAQTNLAIINAPAPTGVTASDPSIAGTPKTYSNGSCQ